MGGSKLNTTVAFPPRSRSLFLEPWVLPHRDLICVMPSSNSTVGLDCNPAPDGGSSDICVSAELCVATWHLSTPLAGQRSGWKWLKICITKHPWVLPERGTSIQIETQTIKGQAVQDVRERGLGAGGGRVGWGFSGRENFEIPPATDRKSST